jgi:hypothetical protein
MLQSNEDKAQHLSTFICHGNENRSFLFEFIIVFRGIRGETCDELKEFHFASVQSKSDGGKLQAEFDVETLCDVSCFSLPSHVRDETLESFS